MAIMLLQIAIPRPSAATAAKGICSTSFSKLSTKSSGSSSSVSGSTWIGDTEVNVDRRVTFLCLWLVLAAPNLVVACC